ncbi:uncharacterized protein BP5553_07775 [Venustampulla echinocandica]|uniref:Uncharacterized protein n=1 Tax=Venustampulla echinocandica TaxID=2656787 RepID=A0A370THH4_9HELO|nr:uncharacterized protein BP5553_07775 [Venustampulla echinocandica]RDL34647.1 hypothetical protein BP5553_07775 [Venustampulla echinocandica]
MYRPVAATICLSLFFFDSASRCALQGVSGESSDYHVEPALELASKCNSVALLLEDFVGQRSVGVNAVVDGHLQAGQHDRDEAAGAVLTFKGSFFELQAARKWSGAVMEE